MKLTHLALFGLGLYALTRNASAASVSSPSTPGSTGTISITPAEDLPAGILRTGQTGIYTNLIPTQVRANAYNDLKNAYRRLMDESGATALQHAYQALGTPIGAALASGSRPTTLIAKRDTLIARYQATVKPITEWYLAEKGKLQQLYG